MLPSYLIIFFRAPKTKRTSQAHIKPEIFANFRPEPEPHPKSPARLTTLGYTVSESCDFHKINYLQLFSNLMHSVSLGLIDLIMVMMKLTKVLLFEKIMGFYTKIIFATVVFSCFKLVNVCFLSTGKKTQATEDDIGNRTTFHRFALSNCCSFLSLAYYLSLICH